METRAMAKRRNAGFAEVFQDREEPQGSRSYTPPNDIDPNSLYYDEITPNQKARYRLSKEWYRLTNSNNSIDVEDRGNRSLSARLEVPRRNSLLARIAADS